MNKTMIVIALSILFQAAVYADQQQGASNKKVPSSAVKIITPKSGSHYDLNGRQTKDGQYKNSYSTKSIDHRDQKSPGQQKKHQQSRQQKFNTKANNPSGVGVLIVVDE